jgi:hypothetical protein
MAAVDWQAAVTALEAGRLPCPGGEGRILGLTAGIAGGCPWICGPRCRAWTSATSPGSPVLCCTLLATGTRVHGRSRQRTAAGFSRAARSVRGTTRGLRASRLAKASVSSTWCRCRLIWLPRPKRRRHAAGHRLPVSPRGPFPFRTAASRTCPPVCPDIARGPCAPERKVNNQLFREPVRTEWEHADRPPRRSWPARRSGPSDHETPGQQLRTSLGTAPGSALRVV